jgi:hypothetical protein
MESADNLYKLSHSSSLARQLLIAPRDLLLQLVQLLLQRLSCHSYSPLLRKRSELMRCCAGKAR